MESTTNRFRYRFLSYIGGKVPESALWLPGHQGILMSCARWTVSTFLSFGVRLGSATTNERFRHPARAGLEKEAPEFCAILLWIWGITGHLTGLGLKCRNTQGCMRFSTPSSTSIRTFAAIVSELRTTSGRKRQLKQGRCRINSHFPRSPHPSWRKL